MKYTANWEEIISDNDNDSVTYRMLVPGGWLVLKSWVWGEECGETMVFLPDPDHKWRVK